MNRPRQFPIEHSMSRLIDRLLYPELFKTDDLVFTNQNAWSPAVDLKEEANRFLVIADLPGIQEDQIELQLENNFLTIHGKREENTEEKDKSYLRKERVQGQFHCRLQLPETADENKVSASYQHGVLTITIPKKEVAKPKKIKISVSK